MGFFDNLPVRTTELTVAAIEQQMEEDTKIGPVVMQRRAFERLITSEDCATATDILRRAAKRYAAVSE